MTKQLNHANSVSVVVDINMISCFYDVANGKDGLYWADAGAKDLTRNLALVTEGINACEVEAVARALHNIYAMAIQLGCETLAKQTKVLQTDNRNGQFPGQSDLKLLLDIGTLSFEKIRNHHA